MVRIYFKNLNIDRVESSSGVFSGDNLHIKWRSTRKGNEGYGRVNGDQNQFTGNRHAVIDEDEFDGAPKDKM